MNTNLTKDFDDIFLNRSYDLPSLLNKLQSLLRCNVRSSSHSITSDLIDIVLFEEIKEITFKNKAHIYFGKTLRDIKCVVKDSNIGEYNIFIQYKGRNKLRITDVDLPYSQIQDNEYCTLEEIITTFKVYVDDRSMLFYQLRCIDEQCKIIQPKNPSYKDTYRKIQLDDNVLLNLDVTPDGLASNMRVICQDENCENKVQKLLFSWNHSKDIIENILEIYDALNFSTSAATSPVTQRKSEVEQNSSECGICLSADLPDEINVPEPLCVNTKCGVHFHRTCLVQWLKTCNSSRASVSGLLIGNCPSCFQPITCNENDDGSVGRMQY